MIDATGREVRTGGHIGRGAVRGGVLLGLGLGAFFDGIVLHQLLQWHHMFSAHAPSTTVAGLRLNTLGDGLFHLGAYIFTIAGVFALWNATRGRHDILPTWLLVGALLIGWGAFNLVEGLIDHQILGIHHVRAGPYQLAYDLGFLAWGALMLLGGLALVRGET